MAVARQGKSLTMTAGADAYAGIAFVTGLSFQGSGLTPGQRLRLTDSGGSIVCDYLVEAAIDNADLWGGREPQFYQGLLVQDGPAAGAWVLTVMLG